MAIFVRLLDVAVHAAADPLVVDAVHGVFVARRTIFKDGSRVPGVVLRHQNVTVAVKTAAAGQ